MRYGFIGLGNLGGRLCRCLLQAGFEVNAHDRDPTAMAGLVAAGARSSASPAAAAVGVDALITCLPSPAASEAALFGDAGAITGLAVGSTWIEMGTVSPEVIKTLSARAAQRGVQTLEAPVTGGIDRAERGEITIFVGGAEAEFARHRPALDAMGGPIFHLGALGSASTLKVITNLLCLTDLVASGEALMLAKQAGLDLGQCYEAICASSGTSREFEEYAPRILDGSFNTGFTLDLACKDLGFVADLGRAHDVPLPLATLVQNLFDSAREIHGPSAWTPTVLRAMEQHSNATIRAEGFEHRRASPANRQKPGFQVSHRDIETFRRDGVVCLRGCFDCGWIEELRALVDDDMLQPSGMVKNINAQGASGFFFGDTFVCHHLPGFRRAVFESPAAAVMAALFGSDRVNLLFDQILVKEPRTSTPTLWHQDITYWPVAGEQVATLWLALDSVTRETGAVEYVRGSHLWGQRYLAVSFDPDQHYSETLPPVPDIERDRARYDIVSFELEPGDCTIHDARMLHGAPPNASTSSRRRAYIQRLTGDDVIYNPRPNLQRMLRDPGIPAGAALDSDLFPRVWSRDAHEPTA